MALGAAGIFQREVSTKIYTAVSSGSHTFGIVGDGFTRLIKDVRFKVQSISLSENVVANTFELQDDSSNPLMTKALGNFYGHIPFYLPIVIAPAVDTMLADFQFVHRAESDSGTFSMEIRFVISFYEKIAS